MPIFPHGIWQAGPDFVQQLTDIRVFAKDARLLFRKEHQRLKYSAQGPAFVCR